MYVLYFAFVCMLVGLCILCCIVYVCIYIFEYAASSIICYYLRVLYYADCRCACAAQLDIHIDLLDIPSAML